MNNIEIDRNFVQVYEGKPGYMKKLLKKTLKKFAIIGAMKNFLIHLGFASTKSNTLPKNEPHASGYSRRIHAVLG